MTLTFNPVYNNNNGICYLSSTACMPYALPYVFCLVFLMKQPWLKCCPQCWSHSILHKLKILWSKGSCITVTYWILLRGDKNHKMPVHIWQAPGSSTVQKTTEVLYTKLFPQHLHLWNSYFLKPNEHRATTLNEQESSVLYYTFHSKFNQDGEGI